MPRAIWTGSVGFGLVQIPVALHAAEEKDELDLTLLDRRDFSPVGYERVNKKTGNEVPWDEIVKGYDEGEGKFVVLSDAELKAANVKATQQVDIEAFVELSTIDPRYIDRPYYLAPQKAGKKAYALLREALHRTGKAGIGKVVLKTRQHLAALVAQDKVLLLILLRFADELRDESDLDLPDLALSKIGVTPKEVSMAEKLVESMVDEFDPTRYHDEYRSDLLKLIRAKAKAGELNTMAPSSKAKPRKPTGAKVIDLAALLAQSVSGSSKVRSEVSSRSGSRSSHAEVSKKKRRLATTTATQATPHHRKSA